MNLLNAGIEGVREYLDLREGKRREDG